MNSHQMEDEDTDIESLHFVRMVNFVHSHLHPRSKLRKLIRIFPIRQLLRRRIVARYQKPRIKTARSWIWKRTEDSNFYYDLTPSNRGDLANLIAFVTGKTVPEIKGYIQELSSNEELRDHISSTWKADSNLKDAIVGFGRREGWYALIRALKPELVVETGVSHGVGACVIATALLQNRREGHDGKYLGTDWDPEAGILFSGQYAQVGAISYGDSIESLMALNASIDLFINDSDHSVDYEGREYEVIASKLSDRAFILGDNSHASPSLRNFAEKSGRNFLFFKEVPKDHWYPGGGIGISSPRKT
jgi:hypothetical protein